MLKYSVKTLLYTHQADAKGQHPIYIRITIARKPAYISTGHYIDQRFWEDTHERVKKDHLLAKALNADITARKQAIVNVLAGYQLRGEQVTAAQVKQLFISGTDANNIFDFVELFVKEVKHKREAGTLENYRKHLKVLEDYNGSRSLTFEQINYDFLVGFEDHLRAKVGGNYIYAIWKTLKTLFNAARKRGVIKVYPFESYENPEYKAPGKDYLTLAELDKMEHFLTAKNYMIHQSILYYLLGCYSGLRVSDWYRFSYKTHLKEGRLQLWTKKNGELVTMKIMGRLSKILDLVKETPLTITEQEINRTIKDLAKASGIDKKLTTHTARHTFAITMCADQDISAETCAELMGITLKTCVENYYKVTNRKIDKETERAWEGL